MHRAKGFTLIELLVVISIIALLIGILLPALGAARATARRMQSNTQIRGMHQAMVMFAESNREYFPGIRSDGTEMGEINDQEFNTTTVGGATSNRYARLLNGNFFTPDYAISPADSNKREAEGGGNTITRQNYSYSMLAINFTWTNAGDNNRRREWSATMNTEAVIVGDRARGDVNNIYSVHTREASNDWRGGLARNDNSVTFETDHERIRTRYGSGNLTNYDNIFLRNNTSANDANGPGEGLLIYGGPDEIFD